MAEKKATNIKSVTLGEVTAADQATGIKSVSAEASKDKPALDKARIDRKAEKAEKKIQKQLDKMDKKPEEGSKQPPR